MPAFDAGRDRAAGGVIGAGGLDRIAALIATAHDLGLKVITHQVLSPSSDLHPWFRESRIGDISLSEDRTGEVGLACAAIAWRCDRR